MINDLNLNSKIYVSGHNGMVGSAIWKNLQAKGYNNLIGKSSTELDLRNQKNVEDFFTNEKPEYVFIASAKVGGIHANNTFRAQFIYDNLMIQNNLIHSSHLFGVKKLLFLGSSCIYPRDCPQPMKEKSLLSNKLEETNEPYAIAKIAGIKLCENYFRQYNCNFISAMPTNLYGPGDNYDLNNSHVIPALMRKFHEAKIKNSKSVEVWGTGKPKREFLHVDDMADACIFLMTSLEADNLYNLRVSHVNIGSGHDLSIRELSEVIGIVVGYQGEIVFNETKPDGAPRKLLDVSYLKNLGWNYKTELKEGLTSTYKLYSKQDINIKN
tara:strand:+ start:926 stop:1900 length:975 start_codon:yes stop_codon:yes gene_type:complete